MSITHCKFQALRLIHLDSPSRCRNAMTSAHIALFCSGILMMCRSDSLWKKEKQYLS